MTQAAAQTITILRSGAGIGLDGKTSVLSETDLAGLVASYDALGNPAPIVVGQPKLDDPAYGWIKRLGLAGSGVQATVEHIEPAFAAAVKAGSYPTISASLYRPDSNGNPAPGRWYLRHISFSGASAPAGKGRGQVSFAEPDGSTAQLRAVVSNGIKTRFNLPCGRMMTCDSEELAARARDVRECHRTLSFADAVIVAILDVALDDPVVSFGERDPNSETAQRALLYRMKRAKMIDPSLTFSEAKAVAELQGPSTVSFAAPYGWKAPSEGVDLYQQARALQMTEPGLGIVAAAVRIQRGR